MSQHVLSVNNHILGELIESSQNNPVGNYGVLDLVKKHINDGGKAVLYDKLTGKITHHITLDENGNFKFINYK